VSQERARFTAEVSVGSVTAIYADGHTTVYAGPDDVRTIAFKPVDRPNFIRPLEMVMYGFKKRGISPLRAVPNETLAAAAKFGEAKFISALDVTLEDRPEVIAREAQDKLVVSLSVDYSITVRRQLDA
jgi:hypothetical protein